MEKILLNPWIIVLILLWTLPWKGAALWRAARRGHIGWFLTLLILNTLAILDILYIFFFSNNNHEQKHDQDEVRQVTMQYREQQARKKALQQQTKQKLEIENTQQSTVNTRKRQTIV